MANDALDTLQIDILASGTSAVEGIARLADAIKNLRDSVGKGTLGKGVANGIKGIISAAEGSDKAAESVNKLAEAVERLSNSATNMPGIARAIREVRRAVESPLSGRGRSGKNPQGRDFMPPALRSDGVIGMVREQDMSRARQAAEDVANEYNSTLQYQIQRADDSGLHNRGFGNGNNDGGGGGSGVTNQGFHDPEQDPRLVLAAWTMAFRQMEGAIRNIRRLLGAVGRAIATALVAPLRLVGNLAASAARRVRDLAIKGIMTPFNMAGNAVKKFTSLFRAIGRIAIYRAIRSAMRELTQGLSEGIQNLYQWSLLVDKTFANSMDSIASSMQYLKNGFASMFSPLINAAAPILEYITNKLVDFFNVVQQIFAALTGASTWTKAIRVQKAYAEAVTDTGKAADKAMHQVMAFDELNIINSPRDSGTNGAADNTPDYASMFVTQEVDTKLASWVEQIKSFFESGQFRELGAFIADKLNGLVDRWNAQDQGFRFGERIRHALEAINGFLETFQFYNLGAKIAQWFIGLWDGITPSEAIRFIKNVLISVRDFTAGFLETMWAEIKTRFEQNTGRSIDELGQWLGEKLNGWVKKWKAYEQGFTFGDRISRVLHQVNDFLRTFSFYDLGSKIGDWIGGFVDGITPDEVADAVANIINAAIGLGSGLAQKLRDREVPQKIGTAIGLALASIDWAGIADLINNIVEGLALAFRAAIDAFFNKGGWQKAWDAFRSLSLPAQLMLTIPIVFELARGVSLVALILSSLGVANAAAAAGIGLFTVVGGALVLTISIAAVLASGHEKTIYDMVDEALGITTNAKRGKTYGSHGGGIEIPLTPLEEINKNIDEMRKSGPFDKSLWSSRPDETKDVYRAISPTGGSSGGHRLRLGTTWAEQFEDAIYLPVDNVLHLVYDLVDKSDLSNRVRNLIDRSGNAVKDSIRNADIPGHGRQTTETAGREIKAAIDAADLPGKARTTANSAGTSMKDAITAANVPGRFRETALASISEFGKQDFASAGRQAGGSLRTGFDSGGVVSTVTTAAANAMAAFRNAAWASTGATAGATLGRTFKDHFVANAKSTLMLQTAAGKPITQAYVVPYANGGYVQGSLFLAGEVAGQAEMVGSINGRTGVASGEEITGIRESVDRAGAEEANLLRQLLVVGQALLAKDPFGTPNSAAGRWIAQSQQAYGKVTG